MSEPEVPASTGGDEVTPSQSTAGAGGDAGATDVFNPDGERQDDGDVTPGPAAQNTAVVDDPSLSREVADAVAAEINAAETSDAATAGSHSPGGEAAPDPE